MRPSPAAATQAVSSARKSPKRNCRAAVAAPGDGRTPRWLTQPPGKARTGSAAVPGRSNPDSLERVEITQTPLQGRSCCARGRAHPSVVDTTTRQSPDRGCGRPRPQQSRQSRVRGNHPNAIAGPQLPRPGTGAPLGGCIKLRPGRARAKRGRAPGALERWLPANGGLKQKKGSASVSGAAVRVSHVCDVSLL